MTFWYCLIQQSTRDGPDGEWRKDKGMSQKLGSERQDF